MGDERDEAEQAATGEIDEEAEAALQAIQREEADEGRTMKAPSGATIYEAIAQEGELELARPTVALAYSGLAAGLSMGFSFLTMGWLAAALPKEEWAEAVAKLGYSVGFLLVVLGRQQLFTENTLTPILPLLRARDLPTLAAVGRLWATVLATNVLGALLFATVVGRTHMVDAHVHAELERIAAAAVEHGPGIIFLRGIFAGWLISLMVWLLPFSESGRIWVIIIVTSVIALGELSHVIAGSIDVLYLVVRKELSVSGFFLRFFLPTLAGNVLGGVTLVSALAHAQVAADRRLGSRPATVS